MSPSNTPTARSKPTTVDLTPGYADAWSQTYAPAHCDPGQAFIQNLRSGRQAITAGLPVQDRVRVAFDELAPQRNPDCAWASAADRYGR